jgi:outer membrane protein OmpA-like peptidoglycan-associated protein
MKLFVVVCAIVLALTVRAQEHIVFEAGGTKGWSMFPHIESDSIYCAPAGNILRLGKGQTRSRGWFWLAPTDFNQANDYRIEARLRQTGGDIFNGFGIAYGYQDPDNYACFMISSWKQAKLASSENGKWYDWRDMLQLKSVSSLGEWNTLVFEKKNQEVTFTVNDVVVLTASSPKVSGKGIGFLAHSTLTFEVEYLKLTEAPSGKLKTVPVVTSSEALPNATMRFQNILFDPGKIAVRSSSYGELNQVLGFLRSNTQVRVEIGGHTDNIGRDATNLALSEERAKSVMSYLINKGISPSRITAKGYGESQPIAPNDTEDGRKKNRRVEFKVSSGTAKN